MINNRTQDLQPLRWVIIAGNLLATALEHPEKLEAHERRQIIVAWNHAIERLRKAHIAQDHAPQPMMTIAANEPAHA